MVRSAVLLLLLCAACGDAGDRQLARQAETFRTRRDAIERLDDVAGAPLAGVSAQRVIPIAPLDLRGLSRAERESGDFHHFWHRCAACHDAPSPALHTAGEWRDVVPRMQQHMRDAGLLPMSADEQAAVLRFLERTGRR